MKIFLAALILSSSAFASGRIIRVSGDQQSWRVQKVLQTLAQNPPKKPTKIVVVDGARTYTISVNGG